MMLKRAWQRSRRYYVDMGLRLVPRISMDFSPPDGGSPRVAGCLQDVAKATVSMGAEKL
ncbi:hypothetical protein OOY67_000672 [Vibrio parahaemolyticus]|nr:hypothetical protein [Vibrio parahaemolyticus]